MKDKTCSRISCDTIGLIGASTGARTGSQCPQDLQTFEYLLRS